MNIRRKRIKGKTPFISQGSKERKIQSACPLGCDNTCRFWAHIKEGKLVKIEPASFPDSRYNSICLKGLLWPQFVYQSDRLKYPLKRVGARGKGNWRRISWDEALERIVSNLNKTKAEYGAKAVCFLTLGGTVTALNGASRAGLVQRFASLFGGTVPFTVGLFSDHDVGALVCGYGNMGHDRSDFINSKLIILWSTNVSETQMNYMRFIYDAMDKGAKLIVIDPIFTPTASKADEWISLKPGTDAAFALGVMNVIVRKKIYNDNFIKKYTNLPFLVRSDNGNILRESDIIPDGDLNNYMVWDKIKNKAQSSGFPSINPALTGSYDQNEIKCKPAFQLMNDLVEQFTPEKVSEICGISPETIKKFAWEYATIKPAAIIKGCGLFRYYHGDLSNRAITTLAALTGNIGKSGGGVTGVWGNGCVSAPFNFGPTGFWNNPGSGYHNLDGRLIYDCIESGKPWRIKALFSHGNNWVNQCPNQNRIVNKIIPNLDFIVHSDFFINDSAKYADILLPSCTIFEYTDLVLAPSHRYFLFAEKAIEPLFECKSDFQIYGELAEKMGYGEYFNKEPEEYLDLLFNSQDERISNITIEKLKKGPIRMNVSEPFVSYVDRLFPTASGKLEIYSERLKQYDEELPVYKEPIEKTPSSLNKKYPLSLLTTHSRWRINSTFSNIDLIKQLNPEPILEINPRDAEKRNIQNGEVAIVFNSRGTVKLRAKLTERVRPGVIIITEGYWRTQFLQGHTNELSQDEINPVHQKISVANTSYYDCAVEVKRDWDG